ncbi:MAG TPA: hypothetical protein VGM39_07825 [Kofleriaceae bacterium]
MRLLSKFFAVSLLTLAIACGGGGDSAPGPLSHHFDDMFVADVGMDQKTQMLQAQNDWSLAKAENAKAEADVHAADSQISNAKNDVKAAQLQVDNANNDKKTADATKDNNNINAATAKQHNAQSAKKASEARVKYLESYKNWLGAQFRYTQENMYWREAQYELAKSTLAQKSGKSPRDQQYDWYPKQEQDRNSRAQSAKGKVDSKKSDAKSKRDAWLSAQSTSDKENGRTSAFADPMAGVN